MGKWTFCSKFTTYRHIIRFVLAMPPFLNPGPQRWDTLRTLFESWEES